MKSPLLPAALLLSALLLPPTAALARAEKIGRAHV